MKALKTTRSWALVLQAALLLATPAFAIDTSRSDVKHDKIDLGNVVDKRDAKNKKPKAQRDKRASRSEAYGVQVEKRLIQGIDTTTAYLRKTANRMPKKSASRLEILEKLLNLYQEQAFYVADEEDRHYNAAWEKWDVAGRSGPEPKLENTRSRKLMARLARESQQVLGEYPKAKDADVITLNYGVALQFLGQEKESARVFSQLIQKYPNSASAGDAYFALGDFFFYRNDFRNAQNNYKQALRYRRSKKYGWALYGLAWCYYNLGNYSTALAYWKQVVTISRTMADNKGLTLKEEALRDMVYAFAELKQVEGAIAYYRANGGEKYIGGLLTMLSDTFAEQGQYRAAIQVLKRYQQIDPYGVSAPDTQKQIVSLWFELNNMPMVWSELSRFGTLYGPHSSWASQNAKDQKTVLETQEMIKEQMLYYAKLAHKNAQKDDNRATYLEAIKGYGLFLRTYPHAKEVAEVKYNLADIENYFKEYRPSGQLYMEIALLGKDKALIYHDKAKPENIHHKASLYMLQAYGTDFDPELKVLEKRKPNFAQAPMPLSLRAKNFIRACALYGKWYPDDKKSTKLCDIAITDVYYHTNNKRLAMNALWHVATTYSTAPEGPIAVDELIPLYKDDRKGLLLAADKLLKIPAYQKGALGKKLVELKRRAEIEDIAKEKSSLKRAQRYEAEAKKAPHAVDADKLWYNAGHDYLAAAAVPAAIASYLTVVKNYPQSSAAQESLLTVAQLYQKLLEFNAASAYMSLYAQKYPKDKETPGALATACELQIAVDSPKALSICGAFMSRYPDGGKPYAVRLIDNAERAQRYPQMTQLIERNYLGTYKLTPNERIIALYKIYKHGGGSSGQEAAGSIIQTFQSNQASVSGEALRYVGEIAFKSVNGAMARYQQVRLAGGTVDRLADSIQKKAAALAQLKAAYDQVIGTKDSYWGTAALYQDGLAHEQFAMLLQNPPQIDGAKPEEVKAQLAPQIKELTGQAKNYYVMAMQSISKFQAYNEYSPRVVDGLSRLAGSKVSFQDWVVTPDFVGADVSTSVASAVQQQGGSTE